MIDVEIEKKGNLTMAYVKRSPNHTRNRSFLP